MQVPVVILSRAAALALAFLVSACYFNEKCFQDIGNQTSYREQKCAEEIQKREDLERLLILAILTGGFPGSQVDTPTESEAGGEEGGAGVD